MSVLRHNQQVKDEDEVYFNFINSIKSEVTKKIYEDGIRLYLKFCNLSKLSELLMIVDPQKQIIEYIMSLRKKGLSSNTISTWLLGIYHLYEMNDVPLNKKKINITTAEVQLDKYHFSVSIIGTLDETESKCSFFRLFN